MSALAVTLALDAESQGRFDAEHRRWHPIHPAGTGTGLDPGTSLGIDTGPSVTVFHALPDALEERVRVDLVQAAGPPFAVGVAGVLPLPGGVAYALASAELTRRHHALQQWWWDDLAEPDRRGLRPHITVQNGVSAAAARATVTVLRRAFRPYEARAEAFVLWRDNAGRRTELARIPFTGIG